jgi:uncharacterized protein YndB with AHSA1/START domain
MTSLTLIRRIAARPSVVFQALTTSDGVAAWWGPDDLPVTDAEVEGRVGGAFRVRFPTADGREHEASGEFLEFVPPRRLVMSWRWSLGGEADEAGRVSRVEIKLRAIDAGTELTFTHADLASGTSRASHERGWSAALAKLARVLADRGAVPAGAVEP